MRQAALSLFLLPMFAWNIAAGETIFQNPLRNRQDLAGWAISPLADIGFADALVVKQPERLKSTGIIGVSRKLDAKKLSGKRIRLSIEVKGESIGEAAKPWNGVKFQLYLDAAKPGWPQANMKTGSFDWEGCSFAVEVPADLRQVVLSLGLQDSCGTVSFRNLRIEEDNGEKAAMVRTVVRASNEWKPVKDDPQPTVRPGSALDRTLFLTHPGPCGEYGRVIVNGEGRLAFAKEPEKPVNFLASCDGFEVFRGRGGVSGPQLDTKEKIAAYAAELRRNGYNMVRDHFLDTVLVFDSKKDKELDPVWLDRFDYYVYCLKQNGVYLNIDAMTSWVGYSKGNPWDGRQLRNSGGFKFSIHFDPEARANWTAGMRALLTHVNPYTKTRLAEDPVLALVQGFNEQEFGFYKPGDWSIGAPKFREFLKNKYGMVEQLRKSWGDLLPATVAGFDDVPMFDLAMTKARDTRGRDAALFMNSIERDTVKWYRSELEKMNCKALLSNYNLSKSLRYSAVRGDLDFVSMNGYPVHPTNYSNPGSVLEQPSSLETDAGLARWLTGVKLAGKPFAITEYSHVFWNRYRYEQPFVAGAYGAFQNFDVLTHYGSPVSVVPVQRIQPFTAMADPIMRASEFLTFFLLRRGDITPARQTVRLLLPEKEIFDRFDYNEGVTSNQSRLALLTGFTTEVVPDDQSAPRLPLRNGEIALRANGSAQVNTDLAGFSSVLENGGGDFNFPAFVEKLRKIGFLPEKNRSDVANNIYENQTGELYLDSRKHLASIDTPRLQGVCREAGGGAKLADFELLDINRRGNISIVSVDGNKPVAEAEKLVLVAATNALNEGMVFDDADRTILRDIGGNGKILLETAKFSFKLHNRNAGKLKLWALSPQGSRREEIPLNHPDAETLEGTIDTARLEDGPTVFFELATK